jgi:hypothetical protein
MRTPTPADILLTPSMHASHARVVASRGVTSRGVAGHRSAAAARIGAALALTAAALALGGCYERVIRATGPATDRQRISEPYQQNYEIDEWIFGTKVPDVRKRP